MNQQNYNFGKIRELLTNAFDDGDLRDICIEVKEFNPVSNQFSGGMSKTEMIRRLIDYARRQVLIDLLLSIVQQRAPRQYALFANRLIDNDNLAPSPPAYSSAPQNSASKEFGRRKSSPMGIGGLVMANVITSLDLGKESRDFVMGELDWLFHAVDNLLRIGRGEIERNQAVAVPIPPQTQYTTQANNHILNYIDIATVRAWQKGIEDTLETIDQSLENLRIIQRREGLKGVAGVASDIDYQHQLKTEQIKIIRKLTEIAQIISLAYGVTLTSLDKLIEEWS